MSELSNGSNKRDFLIAFCELFSFFIFFLFNLFVFSLHMDIIYLLHIYDISYYEICFMQYMMAYKPKLAIIKIVKKVVRSKITPNPFVINL